MRNVQLEKLIPLKQCCITVLYKNWEGLLVISVAVYLRVLQY